MSIPATGVVRYSRFFSLRHVDTVLDYGAGTLRNALYLAGQGFKVYAADVPEQVKVLQAHPGAGALAGILEVGDLMRSRLGVDLVLSTYVFNIIVTRAQRGCYLDNAVANLRPGGYFLLEVNSRRDEFECGSTLHHYLGCDDKGKSYTHQELDRLLVPYGFRRICHYYSSHALAAVYRLAGSDVVT